MARLQNPHFVSRSRQVIDESLNKRIVSCGVNREKSVTSIGVLSALDETKDLFFNDIYASNYILTGAHGLHSKSRLRTDIAISEDSPVHPVVARIDAINARKFRILTSEEYHAAYYSSDE